MKGQIMISNADELLQQFLAKEVEQLEKAKIHHPTLIGDMYEGLTKTILDLTIPEQLDLRVVSGLIDDGEKQSKQIDCMLVEGEGKPIPHTSDFVYHIHDVIAVIEVKKNLYSSQLSDGYANLQSVAAIAAPKQLSDGAFRLFEDAFQSITHTPLPPYNNLGTLPFHVQMIYHTLLMDVNGPLRIIFAYNGFANEGRLRSSFLDFIDARQHNLGYSPGVFPDLIVCKRATLVKLNGMPYAGSLINDFWPFYCSYSGNPLTLLLELIWTRLSYNFELGSALFGEDMQVEVLKPFLLTRCVKTNATLGWEMIEIPLTSQQLAASPTIRKWQPTYVTMSQFTFLNNLFDKGSINTTGHDFIEFVASIGSNATDFIKGLIATNLVLFDGVLVMPATKQAQTAILPDGSFVVGENNTGQFSRWIEDFIIASDESDE